MDPVSPQDAATKAYVDLLRAEILELQLEVGIKVQDADGNVYNTIKIGNQVWLQENLRTAKYNDGTPIPFVFDGSNWASLTSPAYCLYDTSGTNYTTYSQDTFGFLYNYYVVADTNSLNLCPTGWHVPTDVEWTTLITYLGGTGSAGGKMKETGTYHWNTPNWGATNESGFSGLPGGFRDFQGSYNNIGDWGYWWSSTEFSSADAWRRYLYYNSSLAFGSISAKRNGFSVRCIKD